VHSPQDICTAIHALLRLRAESPAFTSVWQLWTDASKGKMLAHGAVAAMGVLVLAGGIAALVMTAPVSVPAATVGGAAAATGAATVGGAAATTGTAAVATTAVAVETATMSTLLANVPYACITASGMTASGVMVAGNEGYNTYKSIQDLVGMKHGECAE
jgi:hypothetical protein